MYHFVARISLPSAKDWKVNVVVPLSDVYPMHSGLILPADEVLAERDDVAGEFMVIFIRNELISTIYSYQN